MNPEEKALEMYNNFHVYEWNQKEGYITNDVETKKMVRMVIEEIEQQAHEWGIHNNIQFQFYWIKVRNELKLIK